MNTYRIDFAVNGKVNPHGFLVQASSLLSAVESGVHSLHNLLDGVVDSFELLSVSVERCS